MTRLVHKDIFEINKRIKAYDQEIFRSQTGRSMREIACIAAGGGDLKPSLSVACVTVTGGLGEITDFAGMNAAILRHCGADAEEMKCRDVAGIQEAFRKRKDLILMADDDVFSLFGAGLAVESDNGDATGTGYAAALAEAIKHRGFPLEGQKILVLGGGPVGRAAAVYLAEAGAIPCIYDLDLEKAAGLVRLIPGSLLLEIEPEYGRYSFILDATTTGDQIGAKDVSKDTIISAPGVPCIATEEAAKIATVIHNPLELGVITMYYQCLARAGEMGYGNS
ncbi:MAG: 3-methylornithyl-N6-L-lysine dehydrogenase PylD [Lachnospiraceae bacterium]|nr:3-methylornithyl-N6-L-lysine dehydrogenase PylD [Lachnospiraceae bacterium]